jgi:AraC family transcriptional regulator, arabinose operon regulatory protein
MRGFRHFFTVPPLQSKRLTIRGIGVQEAMPACIVNRPKGTGDYLLMYFYDPVWVAASELPTLCPAGTLMIWTPGRWQYYGDRGNPFRHSWIHCDGAMIRNLLKDTGLPLDTAIRVADPAVVERHLIAIHDELTRHGRPDVMIVRNLLDNLFREIARGLRAVTRRQVPETLLRVRHLIESEYERKMPLAELAAAAGSSVSHFCEMFHRHFGMGAHEYLLRHRMHRAAYLLRDQNLAVKQVSRQVGYADAYAFSKLFKRHFGVSPTGFRKQEPRSEAI